MGKTKLTRHATSRMKQRGAARTANGAMVSARNALNNGLTYDDAVGEVKQYIGHLYAHNRNTGNACPTIRIYGEHVYIYCGKTLLTVYPIPDDIRDEAMAQYRKKKQKLLEIKLNAEKEFKERMDSIGFMGGVTIDGEFPY